MYPREGVEWCGQKTVNVTPLYGQTNLHARPMHGRAPQMTVSKNTFVRGRGFLCPSLPCNNGTPAPKPRRAAGPCPAPIPWRFSERAPLNRTPHGAANCHSQRQNAAQHARPRRAPGRGRPLAAARRGAAHLCASPPPPFPPLPPRPSAPRANFPFTLASRWSIPLHVRPG